MAYQSNAVLRRALLERLASVGLCPDLRNDETAVAQVCEQTGCSRDEVVRELAHMRVERGESVLHRMGLSARVPAFLASVSTSRHLLLDRRVQQLRASERYAKEYGDKGRMTTQELISDLDMFDAPPPYRRERHELEN